MRKDFLRGFGEVWPMLLAYAPIAALWGAVAAAQGFSPLEAVLMSAIVYSGTAQFVSVDLLKESTPLSLIVFAVATVGLRHVLMSASISRHIQHFPKAKASILMFWLTDEAWAILERRALHERLTPAYFFGASFPLWPNWVLFSGIGAVVGNQLGDGAAIGLDFAFAAMFIAVLAGFWKGPRTGAILAMSALAACLAKLYVPGAWYILIGGVAGMIAAVLLHSEQETE
ncbi:MAG: AzlC family ABC transporter permease [Phyllobacteriaceae bacterium]|nr:AzlC family ABC transporter permease [Phyllobacteriaceae bacterium]